MAGFKPFGIPACELEPVKLHLDEYESFNLVNYENLSQDLAAEMMGVSRPTFTRIYNSALKKIARAFVEGNSIEIEGGNVVYDRQWYKCKECFKLIDGLENHKKCKNCKLYSENELVSLI
jgi:predicted DNA-binding protein (UPF0251 family)